MRGRKPKLTPEIEATLINAVTIGVPLRTASELAGVAFDTVLKWIQRGEGRHPIRRATAPYVQFAHALKKAEAQDQARRVARIEQAARGGQVLVEKTSTTVKPDGSTVTVREVKYSAPLWVADAWHLERTDPKHWGRRDRLDVHRYREKISKRAKELSDKYDLDIDELIDRAERYANGLDEDDDD
jgi:hypothetical protein